MTRADGPVPRAFRRTALPLAAYYGVTLVMPLANGAARSDGFLKHALVVLVVPLAVILITCLAATVAQTLTSACRARP